MKQKNKIILSADTELEDRLARIELTRMQTKIDTLNERTKSHTIQIHELKNEIKELKNDK